MIRSTPWNWDKVDEAFWQQPAEEVHYLLHRWKTAGFKRLLDLGSGIGRHAIFFAENGFSVTAYDLSNSGLKKLYDRSRSRGLNIETVQGDLKRLPFEDLRFDCVLAYHSIYHTDTVGIQKAIHEIQRVIRKNGELYITFISKSAYSFRTSRGQKVEENVWLLEEEDGSVLPHYFVDQNDIKRLLTGFSILRMRQIEDIWEDNMKEKRGWHYYVLAKKV